jgi:hypothetical protein
VRVVCWKSYDFAAVGWRALTGSLEGHGLSLARCAVRAEDGRASRR